MRIATNFLAVVLVLAVGTTVARAQITGGPGGGGPPGGSAQDSDIVGHLTCSGTNGGSINIDVTGYLLDLQQTLNIGSQSSGAGAGKVTFSDVTVEILAQDFVQVVGDMSSRQSFQSCELKAYNADGLTLKFALVSPTEVKLLGGTSDRDAQDSAGRQVSPPVVRVTLSYGAVQIMSNGGNGTPVGVIGSSGSSSVSGGWDQIKNLSGVTQ